MRTAVGLAGAAAGEQQGDPIAPMLVAVAGALGRLESEPAGQARGGARPPAVRLREAPLLPAVRGRARTPSGCASRTRSAPTRTSSCPRRGGSTAHCRSSGGADAARAQHQRRDARASPGAIYKRKWEVDAKRADLESAAAGATERGYEQRGRSRARLRGGQRGLRLRSAGGARGAQAPGDSSEAAAAARASRRRSARRSSRDVGGAEAAAGATRRSARRCFGLGRFEEARRARWRVRGRRRRSCGGWRRPRCSSARSRALRGFDSAGAAAALEALVGDRRGRGPARLHRQGRPGALRRRLPRLAVSHRRPRPPGRVQRAAPGRGALVRLRRLDPRRLLLPEAARAAAVEAGRRDRATPTTSRSCASSPTSSSTGSAATCAAGCSSDVADNWRMLCSRLLAHRPRRRAVRAHVLLAGCRRTGRDEPGAVADDRPLRHARAAARTGSRCATRTGCARRRCRSWSSTRRP